MSRSLLRAHQAKWLHDRGWAKVHCEILERQLGITTVVDLRQFPLRSVLRQLIHCHFLLFFEAMVEARAAFEDAHLGPEALVNTVQHLDISACRKSALKRQGFVSIDILRLLEPSDLQLLRGIGPSGAKKIHEAIKRYDQKPSA